MSVPWWRRTLAKPDTVRADVCIIGGGIVGLSAADACARAGASVVLVERRALGSGASTRNAGFLMRGAASNYADASDTLGRERTRAAWRDSEQNLGLLTERFGIDGLTSFQRVPSSLIAADEGEAEAIERSAALMADDGFEVSLVHNGNDALWRSLRPRVALINPHDAAVNPAAMLERIASVVGAHANVTLIEHSEAVAIEPHSSGVRVLALHADVLASRLLVCTNAAVGELLPDLTDRAQPNRGQMLAMRHPTARLDASYYMDRGSEYIRQCHDGVIVVGGMRKHHAEDERTTSESPTGEVQADLERFAERALDGPGEVLARWAGTMGFSPDGLPVIEPVAGLPDGRALACVGMTGHGMSLGCIAACRASERLLTG